MLSASPAHPRIALLITDLDNTLWDWFHAWHASFSAMINRLSQLSGLPPEVLEPEIRRIHQLRGTTEYSLLLNELTSLRELHPEPADLMEIYDDALHALSSARKKSTRLYPGVKDTLIAIRGQGVPIIGYTESIAYWTEWRIRTLGLDGVLDDLYSSPDHDTPAGTEIAELRKLPPEEYGLKSTRHLHVRHGIEKPNPHVLQSILADRKQHATTTLYVGDSLMRDVAMAQQVGVVDVHARYGVVQHRPEYELLRRVSYWPDAQVSKERKVVSDGGVTPTYVIDVFSELLQLFDFDGGS